MIKLPALVIDKLNTGIIVVDKEQSIAVWNYWLEIYTGKTKTEMSGLSLADACPRLAAEPYQQILQLALYEGQSRFCSGALHHYFIDPADGAKNKLHIRQNMQIEPIMLDGESYALIQINDVTNQYSRVRGLHELIKELKFENQQVKHAKQLLRHQAFYDSLTGVANRALFYDRLEHILHQAERNQMLFALLFLDIDDFKQVNDNLGHLAGDGLLKAVSERMERCIRKTDTLARIGGDEFALILYDIKGREDAELVATKLLKALSPLFEYQGKPISITMSLGIAIFPFDGTSVELLLKAADEAMYCAKSAGKDAFCFYR